MEQTNQTPLVWFVSVDGSAQSHFAFEQCYGEFYKDPDQLIVCSISDKSKTYLPFDLQPDAIFNRYRTFLLSHIHSSKYKIITSEKKQGTSVKDEILRIAGDNKVTAIFIGYTGRKGIKAEPTVMGSTTKYAVLNTKVPLIITKSLVSRSKNKTKGFTFLVCLDGSIKANKGLDFSKKLVKDPNDQVIACMVESAENAENAHEIKKNYENFLKESKFKGEFITLKYQAYIGDAILKFVNNDEKYYVDFLVFGNSGRRSQREGKVMLGSVAEKLLTHVNANVVLLP